jgi:hypothetical protein
MREYLVGHGLVTLTPLALQTVTGALQEIPGESDRWSDVDQVSDASPSQAR